VSALNVDIVYGWYSENSVFPEDPGVYVGGGLLIEVLRYFKTAPSYIQVM